MMNAQWEQGDCRPQGRSQASPHMQRGFLNNNYIRAVNFHSTARFDEERFDRELKWTERTTFRRSPWRMWTGS